MKDFLSVVTASSLDVRRRLIVGHHQKRSLLWCVVSEILRLTERKYLLIYAVHCNNQYMSSPLMVTPSECRILVWFSVNYSVSQKILSEVSWVFFQTAENF